MKRNYFGLLLLLLCGTCSTLAQTWKPFLSHQTLLFGRSKQGIPEQCVRVTAIKMLGNDLVFCMNAIEKPTDTSQNFWQACYWHAHPSLLRMCVMVRPNGDVFCTDTISALGNEQPDTVHFLLKTSAQLGSIWLFDTARNISATLVAAQSGSVLGQLDSLKTIVLSSGDTIVLSKAHGVVRMPDYVHQGYQKFPDFWLVGIPEWKLGKPTLNHADVYDYAVGDVLVYKGGGSAYWGSTNNIHKVWEKRRVLSRSNLPNGDISYTFRRVRNDTATAYTSGVPSNSTYFYKTDTLTETYLATDPKLATMPGDLPDIFSSIPEVVRMERAQDGTAVRYYSNAFYSNAFGSWLQDCPYSSASMNKRYKMGLGEVSWGSYGGSTSSYGDLVGYVKAGDTTGIVIADGILMGTDAPAFAPMRIFPNPAQSELSIYLSEQYIGAVVEIRNLMGNSLLQMPISAAETRISVADWAQGVYFVHLKTTDGREQTAKLMR